MGDMHDVRRYFIVMMVVLVPMPLLGGLIWWALGLGDYGQGYIISLVLGVIGLVYAWRRRH